MGIFDRLRGKAQKQAPPPPPEPPEEILEEGLPFGWIGHHQAFAKECADFDIALRSDTHEVEDRATRIKAYRDLLPVCEEKERELMGRSVYHMRYFHEMVTEGILRTIQTEEAYLARDEEEQDAQRAIRISILKRLREEESVLQADLLRSVPKEHVPFARGYVDQLAADGKITKEKEGRTYRLHMK